MFYTFGQNNSGGSFDFDKSSGITHYVIIEAESAEDANDRAENIGLYFDGEYDCPCCGSRWHSTWDSDGKDVPQIYGEAVGKGTPYKADTLWMGDDPEAVIHYLDGTIEWVKGIKNNPV
jgi:hypothetical protein